MKKIIFAFVLTLSLSSAFTQKTPPKSAITIKIPDFIQPDVKTFYTEYSNHLIKCINAIREKNEARAKSLFKEGEPMVAKSKIIEKKLIMNPAEKQKWMQFAGQVYPLIKEMERSVYYQKLYGGKK